MGPEQRPADEDEVKRAEREDPPETTERQRPATEEEIQEAEKEAKSSSGYTDSNPLSSGWRGAGDSSLVRPARSSGLRRSGLRLTLNPLPTQPCVGG